MTQTTLTNASLSIAVDSEHSRLRLGLLGVFVGFWIVSFSIANALIPSAGFNIIAGIIAFAIAAVASRTAESLLKKRWPSGRAVQIDANGVRLTFHEKIQAEVKSSEAVSALLWYFKIARRGRAPKGWYVIACALEQNDIYLPVYTFASPEQLNTLNKNHHFRELLSEKNVKNVKQDSLRVAGEQRRLRLAEAHRWNDGAEMTFEDFEGFIRHLDGQFPLWLP